MNPLISIMVAASLLGAPAETTTPPDPKLMELVRKLGDKSFRVRELAAKELLAKGSEALGALTVGSNDSDPEVATRCEQLLPMAASAERNAKIRELLAEPLGPLPTGLAKLPEFIKITGDSKANRQLYAEMLGVHHQIIENLDKDPKKASRLMSDFATEAYNRWQQGTRAGRYSYDTMLNNQAEVALFLFTRSHKNLTEDINQANRYNMLLNATKLRTSISGTEANEGIKKLFLVWLLNEKQAFLSSRGLQIASDAGMKEALPIALKLIESKSLASYQRGQAMISVIKLGTKENVKDLEKFLTDKTVIGTINFGNGKPLTAQVRDVAMGVSIILQGKQLVDFGYDNTRFGGGTPTSYYYYGFPDDEAREAAIKKYAEFQAKQDPKK